jgi:hypothetical protein
MPSSSPTSTVAIDKLLGQDLTFNARYACGENVRVLKPKDLCLFDFVILAQTVHKHAPYYCMVKKNCFWYANMVFDACVELFPPDDFDDIQDKGTSGRIRGVKLVETDKEELSLVLHKYKENASKLYRQVKIFFV